MSARNASAGRPQAPDPSSRPRLLDRARGVVDRSIGMAVLRRIAGRRRSTRLDRPASPAAGIGPERDYRMSATYYGASPIDRVRGGTQVAAGARHDRLVRDTGTALVVFAVLALAVVSWPQDPVRPPVGGEPGVVHAATTPANEAANTSSIVAPTGIAKPSGIVAAETDVPTASPLRTHVVAPAPTRTANTSMPTATPTIAPSTSSAAPIATPAPAAQPTAEPTPSPEPTAAPTPEPTPEPTPTPIVEPSPS